MNATRITIADGLCARSVGAEDVAAALQKSASTIATPIVRTGCDGTCWAQPVVTVAAGDGSVRRFERVTAADAATLLSEQPAIAPRAGDPLIGQTRRVLARCGVIDYASLAEAQQYGAYAALGQAYALAPAELVEIVKASALRGRGGAYFPIALKWQSALQHAAPRYLVVNAEEGEPGAYKDRHIMEGDPHLLVEGIAIAAHAAGCNHVFLYINGQARLSAERMAHAIAQASEAGLLGAELTIEIRRGAGGYVCGEESVILNSIEGERAVPRPRPPLPTEAGLWRRPTVINNVETLCNLPAIVAGGAGSFRATGDGDYPGTKLISVSGAVQRPGLIEVPIGTTTAGVIALAGGLRPGRSLSAVVMGGPSGGFLTPNLIGLPLAGGLIHPTGAVLGSGGVVVLDDRTSPAFALHELTAYNKAESCGKCTPCREGSERALAILERAGNERLDTLSAADRAELLELCDVMQYASLCGLGQMAPGPIRSALELFT